MNREDFEGPFDPDSLPPWPCPSCRRGTLIVSVPEDLRVEETRASKEAVSNENWEPDWVTERFSLRLQCTRCDDFVLMLGQTVAAEFYDDDGRGWKHHLAPSFSEPPLPLFPIPSPCPDAIRSTVVAAFRLFWSDHAAAASKLRVALELLFPKDPGSKASLNSRILASAGDEVRDLFMAVKWLGNFGAHQTDLDREHVLDAFELVELALAEHYGTGPSRLKQLAATINAAKGPQG